MKISNLSKIVFATLLLVLLTIAAALWYYFSNSYTLGEDKTPVAKIAEIRIPAEYAKPRILQVQFDMPVARPDLLYQKLETGIKIEPIVRGEWMWDNDRTLKFVPKTDFLPDTRYKVTLSKQLFSPNIKIKDMVFTVISPELKADVINSEFYEDPRDVNNKAVTASFQFNYPINPESIKQGVSVETTSGEKYGFSYKISDDETKLHIISDPVKLGQETDFARIIVFGVKNAYNNKKIAKPVTAKIEIPSKSSFFKLDTFYATILRNKLHNNEPEQAVFVNFSTAVNSAELQDNFALYYTAEDCEQMREELGKNKGNIAELKNVKPVKWHEAEQENNNLKTHIFKFDIARSSGCLAAVISKNLHSAERYELAQDIVTFTDFLPYPLEVGILGDGAIIARNGSHKVVFYSRGVKKLKASVARIAAENLNHLVTQSSGDFAHPFFTHYDFTENNIAEVFEKTLPINNKNPAKADYSSLDLDDYLQNKKGIFLLSLIGFADEDHSSNIEKRLLVITDLGIVVKDNADNSHNIFVADISTQSPVIGARVEVLGKNGLPVLSAQTNADGMAYLPDFSGFHNDKEAVVYKVSTNDDVSFLPINRSDRYLNFSRYDVGGEYDFKQGEYELKSSMFSDRGIYRPGESAYFGIIIRQSDLAAPQKLPFSVEVRNPRGDIVATAKLQVDAVGFSEYRLNLPQNSAIGQYRLSLYVQGADKQQYYISDMLFKVEEFMPDTLKIKANWQGINREGWIKQKNIKAEIELYNLYGNPASQHVLKAKYRLLPTTYHFKKFPNYVFLTPNADQKRQSYEQELPDVMTNAEGKAEIEVDLSSFQEGPYGLQLYIDGLEQSSGRGVSTALGALVADMDYLVGWKADGDLSYIHKNAKRKINVIAINNILQNIERDDLLLRLVRKEYISSLVEQENGAYRYQMVPKEKEIMQKPWQIGKTNSVIELKTDEPGEYILKIENKDAILLADIEYTVAGASNMLHMVDKDAGLGLKLNKEEYTAGETIEMQITAPYSGYGLITIERDSVYAYKWFKTDTSSMVEKIVLPDTVEGNAYVNVAFFRDIQSPEIYMPMLSYAAAAFNINKSDRKLNITLDTPMKVKAGEDLVINYKTDSDAGIVIYGVNQGILQVARYIQPNPLADFLKKKALRVITSQIMDLVLPDMRILLNLAASGGDDSYDALALENNLNPFARKNSKPVAFWSGIINTNEKGGVYRYKVPESFNGEIKVMAVAVSENKFGSAAKSVLASSDFALIPSGPLNVAPGDEFIIGLSVGNLVENSGDDYEIVVKIANNDGFEIINEKAQTIKLHENGEGMVKFRLKALPKLGSKELIFTAQSVKDKNKKAIMPYTLSVRPATPYSSNFMMGHERTKYKLKNVEDLYEEYRLQQLSASVSPMVLATSLLKYLDKFPHYCTEQTISKIFPAMEVFFKYPELLKNIDIYALYDDAMTKLYERQTQDGGFSAWNVAGAKADTYASIYAAHFLVMAEKRDFKVPQAMLERVLAYCEIQAAKQPEGLNDFMAAYATYVLTLSGRVTTNYLLNLEEYYKANYAKKWQNSLSASFMAASYKLLQNKTKADHLSGRFVNNGDIEAAAINDYLLACYFPELFENLQKKDIALLLDAIADGNFTTKTAAWAILALNAIETSSADEKIEFSKLKPQYTPFPSVDFTPQTKDLYVTSNKPFYYAVSQQGFAKDTNIEANFKGMEVYKVYYDAEGRQVTSAKTGDELTVEISYRSFGDKYVSDVAIVDLLAGAFEAVPNSLQADGWLDFAELREDRVNAYVRAEPNVAKIRYKVKVIAQGVYIAPAVFAAALYQPLVRANSASAKIVIDE